MQFNPAPINPISEKLIARYVHSGNSVVQASSVDPTTGKFTTTQPMNWTSGNIYSNIVISYVGGIPSKLFSEWNGSNAYGLQVVDASTFYIVNGSSGNAIITYATGQTVDLTKIQFEYNVATPPLIDLTTVKIGDQVRATYAGIRNRNGWTNIQINFSYTGGTSYANFNIADGRTFEIIYFEQCIKYEREMGMLYGWGSKYIYQQWNGGTSWSLGSSIDTERTFNIYPNLAFTNAKLNGGLANNTVVEIYTTY